MFVLCEEAKRIDVVGLLVSALPNSRVRYKCADTVVDVLVNKIILRFGMPLVIHSDQGREFENGLMKSL